MTDPQTHPLEAILRLCAQAAPNPWYPSVFARANGIPRDSLDPHLDRLRLGGLIHLTDWEPGHGQGYALTPQGEQVLRNPRQLALLRAARLAPPADGPRERPRAAGLNPWERGEAVRSALLSPATPVATYTLIVLNVLVFLAGLVLAARAQVPLNAFLYGGDPQALKVLHQTGALNPADLYQHGDWWRNDWWRLLTCCFVHIGLIHLGVNMYSLYIVGPLLEQMWGHTRFLLLYLIAGLGGSCAMAAYMGPRVIGAGASGALWGILASMVTWVLLNRHYLPRVQVVVWLRQLVFIFLLNFAISFVPGISAAGHFGGGLVGLIMAVPLNVNRFGRGAVRWLALAGVAVVPVVCVGLLDYVKLAERREIRQLEVHLLPEAQRLERDAVLQVARAPVALLLAQPPDQRDPAVVERAVAALTRARDQVNEAALLLARPYRNRTAEEARDIRKELLEARANLWELMQRCLEKGDGWTDEEEDELRRQKLTVQRLSEK
jgi:membrane associated rhomboid family serine protease